MVASQGVPPQDPPTRVSILPYHVHVKEATGQSAKADFAVEAPQAQF